MKYSTGIMQGRSQGDPAEAGDARRCPACDSADAGEAGQKSGSQLLSCLSCRTLYAARLPPCEQFYDDYYGSHNLSLPEAITKRIEEIVAGFASYRFANRLLDVGFGAGSYLSAAKRAGWDVTGVEISRPALEQARSCGLNVFEGELAAARYPDNYFDVVTAVEVLEHVPQPRELVREIARVLRPGGLFWATTPHGRGLSYQLLGLAWSVVCPPEHLQLFSRKGAGSLLTSAGFRQIELRTHGINPAELLHALRYRSRRDFAQPDHDIERGPASPVEFPRTDSSYRINAAMMQGRGRTAIKSMINGLLDSVRLGDSLKIEACL